MDISSHKICTVLVLFLTLILTNSVDADSSSPENIRPDINKLATANNYFALNLYKKMTIGNSRNIIFSPLSLSITFGILFYGARGNTTKEIRSVLGYDKADMPNELVHSSFNHFLTENIVTSQSQYSEYILNIASRILVSNNIQIFPTYKSQVQNLYKTLVKEVNFERDEALLVAEINSWARKETHNKIKSIISRIEPSTAMLLLNAIYFKGAWKKPFPKNQTITRKFYNNGLKSDAKDISYMGHTSKFRYAEYHNIKALELPYKGDNMSMIILLPFYMQGLENMEQHMTVQKISAIRRRLSTRLVDVLLPKFKIRYSQEVSSKMKSLGAKSLFNARRANFSGMSDQDIHVNKIVQKAMIELNEEGSVAAAVTRSVMWVPTSGDTANRIKIFHANYPFFFVIIDKNNMILFVGRVNGF